MYTALTLSIDWRSVRESFMVDIERGRESKQNYKLKAQFNFIVA